jgi:hypothetical protein
MLPFAILDPHTVSGFTFTAAGTGLDFDEVRAPSLFGFVDTKGRHDMFLHGHFTIDAGSGRLLDARMTAENARFGTTVDVRYVENASLDLLVPVEMHERYTVTGKPNQDRLEVSATYSSFRTFQVTVSEQIGTPR